MNKQKGITLITLVVTIVLLIILAGVIINMTVGENGLFEKAKYAESQYEIAEIREEIEIAILEIQTEKISKSEVYSINEILIELPNKINGIILEKEGNIIQGIYKGYNFTINESMILTIEGESMQVSINTEVKEYLGKNSNEKYAVKAYVTVNAKEKISKMEIVNSEGRIITEIVENNIYNKEIELELDKEYKINIEAENGATASKKIQISSTINISNVEQFVEFRDSVNTGLTYEGATINLLNDIDLSSICYKVDGTTTNDVSWESIGSDTTKKFKGTFNGNYRIIDNLYINSGNSNKGLFGFIEYANISGIIIGNNSSVKAREDVSGIVAVAKNSNITDCGNNAHIEGNYIVGGVVGLAECCDIGKCYNKAIINTNTNSGAAFGGVLGKSIESTISYSYNTGTIKAGKMTGGVVGEGFDGTKIYNCYNTGKIETTEYNVENAVADNIGGISSRIRCTGVISYCYNTGDITSIVVHSTGGITGSADTGNLEDGQQTIIENSYNSGNITASGIQIGGIVGHITKIKINNCHILDTIKIQKGTTEAQDDIGMQSYWVGKIVGLKYNDEDYSTLTDVGSLTAEQMPTVYEVVNGLNAGDSQIWSKSNLEQPQLLWEK